MGMRVAFVVPSIGRSSGWLSASSGIVCAMQENKQIEPTILTSHRNEDQAKIIFGRDRVVTVPETRYLALKDPRLWPKLFSTYKQIRVGKFPEVDLVHSLDGYPIGLVGHWLADRFKVPHVITAIGTYSAIWKNFAADRIAYERVLKDASWICPISSGTARIMTNAFPKALNSKKLSVVLLGTDYPRKIPREFALNRPHSETPTILSIGPIKPRKGYHVSIPAFRDIKLSYPNARYWIVGEVQDENYFMSLRKFIEENQVQDIQFMGRVTDESLQVLYRNADVFMLTPQQVGLKFEGFGLVYLEAGAYGLPVIGTDVGGVGDAIANGVTGFVLGQDDVQGITDALRKLLADDSLAKQMGRANRDWVESLTWEKYAANQYRLYEMALM